MGGCTDAEFVCVEKVGVVPYFPQEVVKVLQAAVPGEWFARCKCEEWVVWEPLVTIEISPHGSIW